MKTENSRVHRIRHRGRIDATGTRNHLRKFVAFKAQALALMNAIGGVAGVTDVECSDSIRNNATLNPVGVKDIRAEMLLGPKGTGLTTVAEVEGLGIPIA